MDKELKEGLVAIVGEKNYTENLIDMVSYSYDASEHRGRPACGVWAEKPEQVSEILRLATGNLVPIIPRGAGTGALRHGCADKGGDCSGFEPYEPDTGCPD